MGELLAALSVVAFAFGGVAVAKARQTGPGDGGALLSVVLTVVLSGAVWAARGSGADLATHGTAGLAWFVLSGLLATAIGRSLYFMSVHELGAIKASAVKRAIPVFSVLFGVALLREPMSGPRWGGVGLIAASIGTLAALDLLASRSGDQRPARDGGRPLGYAWGLVSALSYAASYVARKLGLEILPDGALGTFVGALAAMVAYSAAAAVNPGFRGAAFSALTARNRWAFAAALGFSLGQIGNFYAIQFTAVSTVGAIQSLEVFVSMMVAALVLRTEAAPAPFMVATAAVATLGVLLVIVA